MNFEFSRDQPDVGDATEMGGTTDAIEMAMASDTGEVDFVSSFTVTCNPADFGPLGPTFLANCKLRN